MRISILASSFVFLSAAPLAAQNCFFAPSDTPTSGTCNVFPWGQTSSRYQSLFTVQDLGNAVRQLKELSFASCGSGRFTASSITIRFAYFTGPTLSTNFANNLGSSSTVMLNKTNYSYAYTAHKWSDVKLTGTFIYIPARGNLLVDIVFQGASGGTSFHRDTRQRVYANNWTTTPPATGNSDNGALKMRVCVPPFCGNNASSSSFGTGCNSALGNCGIAFQQNWQQKLANQTTTATQVAILESGRGRVNICGLDLYTQARSGNVSVTVSILDFDPVKVLPGKVLASAKTTIGTTAGIYSVKLPTTLIAKGNPFVIGFDNADKLVLPTTSTGATSVYWEFANNAWGSLKSNKHFQYRVQGDSGGVPPALTASNNPVLGQSFAIDLGSAPASRAVAITMGASNKQWGVIPLPFDLSLIGGTGCKLLVSADVIVPGVTDAMGKLPLKIPLPRVQQLCNTHLYFQCLVNDPKANALTWIVSNAIDAHLGQ